MSEKLDACALVAAALLRDEEAASVLLDAVDLRPVCWSMARLLAGELEVAHERYGRDAPLDRVRATTAKLTAEAA